MAPPLPTSPVGAGGIVHTGVRFPSAVPARVTGHPWRMMRSAALAAALVVSAATMPILAGPAGMAAGATPTTDTTPAAVRGSLRSELTNYLHTYQRVEHISAV